MKPKVKKRVLVLIPVFDLGGAEKQGLYIARSLQRTGSYEVEVACLEEGTGKLLLQLKQENLHTENLNIPFAAFQRKMSRLGVYWKFFRFVRKKRYDVILPFTYHCNVLSTSVYRFAGVKTCLWFQIAMEYHIPLSAFEKLAIRSKPTYAANSKAAAQFIADKHHKVVSDIYIIPNPFEAKGVEKSGKEWRSILGIQEKEIMLFMAANFFQEKDHGTLIHGFSKALQESPNLKLVLAGDDSNGKADWVRSLCFELGLTRNTVLFLGSVSDIPGLIQAADICLLTSVSEGSPNALIEYLGYGKPVVVSAIPSILELTGTNYPYQFEAGKAEDLAGKITLLKQSLNTVNSRDQIGDLQKDILTNHSVETNLKAFENTWCHD